MPTDTHPPITTSTMPSLLLAALVFVGHSTQITGALLLAPIHHQSAKRTPKGFFDGHVIVSPHRFALESSARPVIDWFAKESLDSLLPASGALAILDELLSSDALIDETEVQWTENLKSLERRWQEESRPLTEILGPDTTQRVLDSVANNLNEYDDGAVRAFLGSDAINKLFAKILYDGIFEFFQKIDVMGNLIGNLPLIGPVRNQIVTETKRQLDRTLGPLVQGFLRTYTKVAVLQASEFVVNPANRKIFGSANVKLVSSLLERPANSLYPGSDITFKLKDEVFSYLRNVDRKELQGYVEHLYDIVGDKAVEDVVNVDKVLNASPTLQKTVDRLWDRALEASKASSDASE